MLDKKSEAINFNVPVLARPNRDYLVGRRYRTCDINSDKLGVRAFDSQGVELSLGTVFRV